MDNLEINIDDLADNIQIINDNLLVCEGAIDDCGADCYATIPDGTFDPTFDKNDVSVIVVVVSNFCQPRHHLRADVCHQSLSTLSVR